MQYSGVAIAGKAGAGKNTLARQIQSELWERGVWSVEVGFADALKRELLEQYGMTKDMPGGRDKLLEIGQRTEESAARLVGLVNERCDSLILYGVVPLITDMRYSNEYEWAVRKRMVTVRVDATGMDRAVVLSARGEDPEFAYSDDASEVELDEATFDVRFWNSHGSVTVIPHFARVVSDLLDGTAVRVAV